MADRVCAYDHCGQSARLYPCGPRCPGHTPAREAGRTEAPENGRRWWIHTDGTEVAPAPLSASWVHDSRARDKGQAVSAARRRAARGGAMP